MASSDRLRERVEELEIKLILVTKKLDLVVKALREAGRLD